MRSKCILAASILLGALRCSLAKPKKADVIIVLDGFRRDYYGGQNNFDTPHLDEMVAEGAFVPDIAPVFPSSRFPNLASLITGRYSQSHDVIDSAVYSKLEQKKLFANDTLFWNKTRSLGTIWVRQDYSKLKKNLKNSQM